MKPDEDVVEFLVFETIDDIKEWERQDAGSDEADNIVRDLLKKIETVVKILEQRRKGN